MHRTESFLIVQAGALRCALPLAQVREVMRPLPLKSAENLPPGVMGVSVVRGDALPVVDLAFLLNQTESTPGRFVVVRTPGRDCVLAVSGVERIATMESAQWQQMPRLLRSLSFLDEIAAIDGDLVMTLDTGRLLTEVVEPEARPE